MSFQYPKVRLKAVPVKYNIKQATISIPEGAIKSAKIAPLMGVAFSFQYPKVRLKVFGQIRNSFQLTISIPEGAIKRNVSVA